MSLRRYTIPIATDAAGAATVYSGGASGLLVGVYFKDTDTDNTIDITITEEETGAAVLTITNAAADARYLPRQPVQDNAGADITAAYDAAPIEGRLKVVVAQGGANKTATLYVYLDDLGG